MKTARHYDTVTEAVNDLIARGYTIDFSALTNESIKAFFNNDISLSPDNFKIDEIYRFEGNTDPGDEMIVYAISSQSNKIKGTLVNGYGMYANPLNDQIVTLLAQANSTIDLEDM